MLDRWVRDELQTIKCLVSNSISSSPSFLLFCTAGFQSFAVHGILSPPALPSVNSTLQQVLITKAAATAATENSATMGGDGVEMGLDVGTSDVNTTAANAATSAVVELEEPGSSNGSELGALMMPLKQKRSSSASYPSQASNSGSLL